MDLHGLQGDSLHHHGLHHERNLCSGTWTTSSPSSKVTTDLGLCRAVSLMYSYAPLSAAAVVQQLFLLKYVITEVLPPLLMGLSLARVHFRAGWHWLYRTWGKLLAACHRSQPCTPPLPKPGYVNPMHCERRSRPKEGCKCRYL